MFEERIYTNFEAISMSFIVSNVYFLLRQIRVSSVLSLTHPRHPQPSIYHLLAHHPPRLTFCIWRNLNLNTVHLEKSLLFSEIRSGRWKEKTKRKKNTHTQNNNSNARAPELKRISFSWSHFVLCLAIKWTSKQTGERASTSQGRSESS